MLLVIDVGNTRIKAAVFEGNTLLETLFFSNVDFQKNSKTILDSYPKVTDMIVASVGNRDKDDFLALNAKINVHFVTHETLFPFQNLYETPHTLGIDRMVLAAGAVLQFPKQNRLVIDAGTCITYDFVDNEDRYLGGAIALGIRLRYESLHHYTANLPLLAVENVPSNEQQDLIGNSTQQSIHSGVINGVVFEIEGFINEYRKKYPQFIIILTGGDSEFLAKRLKNTIFANSNFLLESLNQIYLYTTKND
ncbi:type III pantothenate kinase [Flavobacterium luteum]|uniref:Type III pantothenate kinase n=1 Tax=Flavobacterium luteum TaxID=2026654 RepID=A0A7J5AIA5_9FLAO|nr:type III pantothenate kinase [Flavobacterium luteum]KAB1157138.1 type III pantothenate kinase [Flavobacterium luteum]